MPRVFCRTTVYRSQKARPGWGFEFMTDHVRREVLPIPDPQWVGVTTYDAKDPDTTFPPINPVRPPAGAPNVLVILLDDVGFGASSAFGGPCNTPTFERLAADGLKYTRFHTTALCSPTRAALLSGRNHHSVGMGGITEIATSAPGYSSLRPKNKAPLAEILKLNGYSTAHFGKCHEVPVWETSPMGPFDRWPSPGNGFEHFYGFIGGETNQYAPAIYQDTVPIEPDRTAAEGYHFTEDMTDRSIEWIRQQKALMPDKPFFVYWAPGATHAPHHVPTGVVRQVQGRVRRRLGRPARANARSPEGARGDPARRRADAHGPPRSRRGTTCPTTSSRCSPARWRSTRVPRAHRPPRRSTARCPGRARHPRRHADLLHHRRQRRIRRGHTPRDIQRAARAQRRESVRDDRVHGVQDRPVRDPGGVQPLRGRLGPRHGHARTSGPSRSRATGAERATARSCVAGRYRGERSRSATSSTT